MAGTGVAFILYIYILSCIKLIRDLRWTFCVFILCIKHLSIHFKLLDHSKQKEHLRRRIMRLQKICIQTSRCTFIISSSYLQSDTPHTVLHLSSFHIHFRAFIFNYKMHMANVLVLIFTLQAHKVLILEQIADDSPHHWIMASSSFLFPWCFLKRMI